MTFFKYFKERDFILILLTLQSDEKNLYIKGLGNFQTKKRKSSIKLKSKFRREEKKPIIQKKQ